MKIIHFQDFGYEHLSAGDLLRAERQRPNSEFGEEIENHIRNGTIVPVKITCSLLHRVCIVDELLLVFCQFYLF